jgi:hypothetical protein
MREEVVRESPEGRCRACANQGRQAVGSIIKLGAGACASVMVNGKRAG